MRLQFPILTSVSLHPGGQSITVNHYYESHYKLNESCERKLTASECPRPGAVEHIHTQYQHSTESGDVGAMSARFQYVKFAFDCTTFQCVLHIDDVEYFENNGHNGQLAQWTLEGAGGGWETIVSFGVA